jgi:hypothetical protein
MGNLLSIFDKVNFDETVTKYEYHTYQPYSTNTFNFNDEIRIPVNSADIYIAPSESYLYIEGRIEGDGTLTNNAFAFMFEEIRYELNGMVVDKVRDVGITTTMKNLISLTEGEKNVLEMSGWSTTMSQPATVSNKNFSACLPLKRLLGLFEDYNKIMLGSKHELVLFRSKSDLNCMTIPATNDGKIIIEKIEWHIPHVYVNDDIKIKLLNAVKQSRTIDVPFRTWDLYELPSVRQNTYETWSVKTTSNVERPRYVIVGFQTKRKNEPTADCSKFDHCNLRNVKLYINSETYPYDNLNLKFAKDQYGEAYVQYVNFMKSYYGENTSHPILSYAQFKTYPLFVIDCSKQNETSKMGACNVRLELEGNTNFPADTIAYCLIIHDCLFTYNPFTTEVRKVI